MGKLSGKPVTPLCSLFHRLSLFSPSSSPVCPSLYFFFFLIEHLLFLRPPFPFAVLFTILFAHQSHLFIHFLAAVTIRQLCMRSWMTVEACVLNSLNKEDVGRAGALVKWLWEETHVPKVVGSNPGTICWMDMTFFHIDLLLKLYCLFGGTENKRKRGRGGPFFKKKEVGSSRWR